MIQAHPQSLCPNRRRTDPGNPGFNLQSAEPLLTLKQACQFLALSPSTLYRLAERRQVPFTKIGSLLRFERQTLLNWLQAQRKGPQVPWQGAGAGPRMNASQTATGGL